MYGQINGGDLDEVCVNCDEEPDSNDPCDVFSTAYNYFICYGDSDTNDPCDYLSSSYNYDICHGNTDSGNPCDPYSYYYNEALCNLNNGRGTTEPNPQPQPTLNVTNYITDTCLKNAVARVLNDGNSNAFSKIANGNYFRQEDQSLTFLQYSDSTPEDIKTAGLLAPSNMYNMTIKLNLEL